mmetsp:Transcript_52975/g.149230  ORF Transcript_52975/g.149230 Transcript_52975/m.149230 type:complete len:287 (+) Transcript_52975:122-982(+)
MSKMACGLVSSAGRRLAGAPRRRRRRRRRAAALPRRDLVDGLARDLVAEAAQQGELRGGQELVPAGEVREAPHQAAVAPRVAAVTTAAADLAVHHAGHPGVRGPRGRRFLDGGLRHALVHGHPVTLRRAVAEHLGPADPGSPYGPAWTHEAHPDEVDLPRPAWGMGRSLFRLQPGGVVDAYPHAGLVRRAGEVDEERLDAPPRVVGVEEAAEPLPLRHPHRLAYTDELHVEVRGGVHDKHPLALPSQQRYQAEALHEAAVIEEQPQRGLRGRVVVHHRHVEVPDDG